MTTDLTQLDLAAMCAGLRNGDFSAVELVEAHLVAAAAASELNSWVLLDADRAREAAVLADQHLRAKTPRPLEGIPLGVKDLFCSEGLRTTACSRILGDFVPHYESFVTQNLKRDGAIVLGKLNHDEFAMGSSTEHSRFGATVNPWRRKDDTTPLTAGGSSGGSAAAVAARLVPAALGTDTGGSIRQPAALTGTVGLKPTYGRCSRWGIIAFASSLDQAGVLTRSVTDAALMLKSMAGYDDRDSTCADRPVPDYDHALRQSLAPPRIGVVALDSLDADIPAATERCYEHGLALLRAAGCTIKTIALPHLRYALPAYYIIAPAEASSNLARYDGIRYGTRAAADNIGELIARSRGEGFGHEVKRRILMGTYVLSAGYYDAYYLKAQRVRRRINDDYIAAFKEVDLILTPTTPTAAFPLGAGLSPISMYLNDILTVGINLAGLPALSLPAGLDEDGLPLGLQLIAPPFDEETLLRGGFLLEQALDFTAAPDPWWEPTS